MGTSRCRRLVFAALLCHAGTLCVTAASDVLLPGRLIPYGRYTLDFGVGDFDGDGKVDILVASSDPDSSTSLPGLSLLHGSGDGTFETRHINYNGGSVLVVSDLNDDGRLDAIQSGQTYGGGQTRGAVSVSLGKGDGTFMPSNVTALGPSSPSFIESGDFNGDGVKDLIALSEIENDRTHYSMWILLGNGDGSFHPPIQMPSAGPVTSAGYLSNQVAVADYNGDGLDDLAVTETYLGISLFVSNGDGTFLYQGNVAGPLVPVFVRTADLNLDGHPDLITDDLGSTVDVYVLFGRGDGTFSAPVGYDTGPSSNTFFVTDLSGDGAPDIVVASPETDEVIVLLNDGLGAFSIAGTHVVGYFPLTFGAADFNRDGHIDLAVGTVDEAQEIGGYPVGTHKVCLLLGMGGGALDSALLYRTEIPSPPFSIGAPTLAAGDLNADGRIDLMSANYATNNVSVFLGNPDGTHGAERTFGTGQRPGSIAAGDYNGDGALDVVTGNSGSLDLSILEGRGDGTFAAATRMPLGYAPTSLVSADFNQDGRADLAVASPARHDIAIFLGQADGTFSVAAYFDAYQAPFHLALADIDGDGHLDILSVAASVLNTVNLLLGRGNGAFESAKPILGLRPPVGLPFSEAIAVAAADFDGDGRLDLAAVDYFNWYVHIFLQSSSGSFAEPSWVLKTATYPTAVAAADLNRDGRPDLVVAGESNQGRGSLSIYVQASGGGFAEPGSRFASGAGPHALVLADLDSDSLPDIAVAVHLGISVLLNHRDADHDGIPDKSDTCIDGDGDGAGDPGVVSNLCLPDNCPDVPNPGQEDLDADGLGNVCDNCPAAANPGQEDSSADGSGDACQPTLAFFGSRASGDTLEILVKAKDPQDDPLSGVVQIYNAFNQDITLHDSLATRSCGGPYLPDGLAGEGLGFTYGAVGAPYLFDLGTVLHCGDGIPDYAIALGACGDQPTDVILSLADVTLPAPLCLRRYGETVGGLDLTIQSFDLSTLILSVPGLLALDATFDHGLPAQIDITDLLPGRPYLLKMTVTDGNTLPVGAEMTFTPQGESRLVFTAPDAPPEASIVSPAPVECTNPAGGLVTLDGSGSSDPDSSPGTHDDIVSFEWYEDFANPGQRLVGTGEVLAAMLPLGSHVLTLKVTDKAGQSGTAASGAVVRDTTPPSLILSPSPATLWPPNHRLVPVQATWRVSDICDPGAVVVLARATNSEPDDAPGTGDGNTTDDIQDALIGSADATVELRAERSGDGPGRVYALTYVARDASGNSVSALGIATVPHDEGAGPEPVLLQLESDSTPGMAHVYWNTVGDADRYDVIQGDLGQVTQSNGVIHLGPVHVLASGQIGTTYSEGSGGGIPDIGKAFFYLVQYREGQSASGWGTESSPWPAEPSYCDVACPGVPASGSGASTRMHRR